MVRYASRMQAVQAMQAAEALQVQAPAAPKPKRARQPAKQGLSRKELLLLESLPEEIERLETERDALGATLADPSTYQEGGERIAELNEAFKQLEQMIADTYATWEDLEARQ